MTAASQQRTDAVLAAWRRFVGELDANVAVRPVVLASWRRCRTVGLDAGTARLTPRRVPAPDLRRRLAAEGPLREIAKGHLEWISSSRGDVAHILCLVDRDGVVLDAAVCGGDAGDGSDAGDALAVLAAAGTDWSEASLGTNAAGTAIASDEPVRVTGAEHYLRTLHARTTAAAPIRGRGGEVIGAIVFAAGVDDCADARADARDDDCAVLLSYAAYAIGRAVADRDDQRRTSGNLEAVRHAADALRSNEARFRSLSAASPVGIFESDTQGNITYANPRTLHLFALAEKEGLGRGWISRIHPEDAAAVVDGWSAALRAAREYEHEYRLLLPDGEIRWVLCRAAPLIDAAGAMAGTVGTVEDVTERRALESQLRQAQKMDAVGQLAAGVAHDFNNLLTVIKVHAQLALDGLDEAAPLRSDLEEIERASSRAASLTRQLLAFSRKQVLQPRVLDLNALVSEIGPMLQRLIGEDIAVATHADPALGRVLADPGQLEQVLVNLAVNARDAMADGGTLTLRTSNVRIADGGSPAHPGVLPGQHVLLAVSDTGCGMPRDVRDRIFEPFFTTKPAGKGTGLGLSMVYGIVKQSGGHVRVDSEPGRGTTFAVYLPRASAPDDAPPAEPAPPGRPRGVETILLVEDEDAVRSLARRILEGHGYAVLEARGGRDALALAAVHGAAVALVVTDMVMPEMSGRDLVERLRETRPELPALFMSGYTDDAIVRRGVSGGVAGQPGFLEKPFTAAELVRAVRHELDGPPVATS